MNMTHYWLNNLQNITCAYIIEFQIAWREYKARRRRHPSMSCAYIQEWCHHFLNISFYLFLKSKFKTVIIFFSTTSPACCIYWMCTHMRFCWRQLMKAKVMQHTLTFRPYQIVCHRSLSLKMLSQRRSYLTNYNWSST